MKYLRFALIPAVLFLLPGIARAGWFWQNPLPQGNPLQSVFFVDNNTGYTVGSAGTILKTTNGGANWASQSSGTTNTLFSVHFPLDAQTGYAVGEFGTILKTTDGGVWVEEETAEIGGPRLEVRLKATPNPFGEKRTSATSFQLLPQSTSTSTTSPGRR
jgi:hypothetical protein